MPKMRSVISTIRRIWNSPTFMTWFNKSAVILKAVILLPLLLIRFDDVELSCWLLFATFSFFSSVLATQTSATCSRMLSMAVGGAKDLSPYKEKSSNETSRKPNWPLIKDLSGTIKFINIIIALAGMFLVIFLGYGSFKAILSDYFAPNQIWLSLWVFAGGQFLTQAFRHYWIVLRGFNQVALAGRWAALVSIVCTGVSVITIICGGKILSLVIIQQIFFVLEIIILRNLVNRYVSKRFKNYPLPRFNKKIFWWAWTPVWKGVVQVLSNRGSLRIGVLVLTNALTPSELASILLAVRLLDLIDDFSTAPIFSHIPKFGRLLGEGSLSALTESIFKKYRLSVWLQSLSITFVPLGTYLFLDWLKSPHQLPPLNLFTSLLIAHFFVSQIRLSLTIALIGNEVLAVKQFILAFLISVILSLILIPLYGAWGFVASVFLPSILIVNILPLQCGCRMLGINTYAFSQYVFLFPLIFFTFSITIVFYGALLFY